MKTSERLRRLSRSSYTSLPMRVVLRGAADELERYEMQEHARILAAASGPQAATEPPWQAILDRRAA